MRPALVSASLLMLSFLGSGCIFPDPPSSCTETGYACSSNSQCCNFQDGKGFCVDGYCADSCVRNSGCVSNCCAELDNGTSACSPRAVCSGLCTPTGGSCVSNHECCNFRGGTGWCVEGYCADACTRDSGCRSNCCAKLDHGGFACAPPSVCSPVCAPANGSCERNGDCCNFLAGNGWCVEGMCADTCTAHSQCVSGCCASLTSGDRVCFHPSAC